MVHIEPLNFDQAGYGFDGTACVFRVNTADDSLRRHAIQARTRQVAAGWSRQERADRLRAGTARSAWLMALSQRA